MMKVLLGALVMTGVVFAGDMNKDVKQIEKPQGMQQKMPKMKMNKAMFKVEGWKTPRGG